MRDHNKLKVFQMADQLVLRIYENSRRFPKEKIYGLTSQLRRAAVSVPNNIVEGCARRSLPEYLRFLDIAYGSMKELQYLVSLSFRLGYLKADQHDELSSECAETAKILCGLLRTLQSKE
jgi:four helix bundle protein